MERYSEALHHFEAAEAIFDARWDGMIMGWAGSRPRDQSWIIDAVESCLIGVVFRCFFNVKDV